MTNHSFKRLLALFLILAVFLTVGCSNKNNAGGNNEGAEENEAPSTEENNDERVLVCGLPSLTPNFHFFELFSINEGICTLQIHDILITKDANGEFQPSAADTWNVSEDGLTYTFHIREDAKFSDGRQMTAEDAAFSLDYARTCTAFASYYECVDTVTVVDEHTMEVVLHYPSALFLSFLTNNMNFALMCKDFYEEMGDDYATSPETMLCSGPYYVSEWVPEVSITYTYNPYYWGEAPDVKTVKVVKITDANSAAVALQTGDIDLYFNPIGGTVYNTLVNSTDITLLDYPNLKFDNVYLNCDWGIFAENPRLRDAVAYAINREDLINIAYEGRAVPCRFLGDSAQGYLVASPDCTFPNYKGEDIEKAKQIMEEENAVGTPITIYSNNIDPYPTIAVYLQGVLNEIGFVADVQSLESGAFSAELYEKGFEICVSTSTPITYDYGENIKILDQASIPYGNYSRVRSDELDALLDKADQTQDVEERKAYYTQAAELLWDIDATIPLCNPSATIAYNNDIVVDYPQFRAFQYIHWAD